jgi:1-deoxy-D-xylulose-5-phosphate reductoisomerase
VPDFPRIGTCTFEAPDLDRFPCLALAYAAGKRGGACPAVLNAANEVAVAAFLENRLPFTGIYPIVDRTLDRLTQNDGTDLDQILAADGYARQTAQELIRQQER